MNTLDEPLTETFNRISDSYTTILWVLLILDYCEEKHKKHHKHTLKLDREFNAKTVKQSRDRYRRQIVKRCSPRR